VQRLVDRSAAVSQADLVASLVPPPRFRDVRFHTFEPDPGHPSQAAARAAAETFAGRLAAGSEPQRRGRWRRRAPGPPEIRAGLYLDGGFGVGKTHLLAALWHAAPPPRAFTTFVELTNLVGALGFEATVRALGGYRLLGVDEFELDDPGDTVLMSSLLTRLVGSGVALAATSNTLPDRLGEGRFAAADFLREIQGLAAQFDVVRIDGDDYRHLLRRQHGRWRAEVAELAVATPGCTLDHFVDVVRRLEEIHPSRYGAWVEGVTAVHWTDVRPLPDQAAALRFVVLVDRLYDRAVPVRASGAPLADVFGPQMLTGGYRKKYFRALSRLVSLTEGQTETEVSGSTI
jgi:cell division protein ZapE